MIFLECQIPFANGGKGRPQGRYGGKEGGKGAGGGQAEGKRMIRGRPRGTFAFSMIFSKALL